MKTFGEICFLVLALAFTSVIGSYVFMLMWKWFIVTTFHVNPVSLVQSMGIMLFIAYLKSKPQEDKEKDWIKTVVKALVNVVTTALFVLGIGWLIFQLI